MNIQKLKNIVNEIDGGVVKPVYLFQGDDQFLQQLVVNKIETTMSRELDCEKIILEPDEMSGSEIIGSLYHTDLFSSQKFFILRNPQKMKGNSQNELYKYLENPIESNCLIIFFGMYDQKKVIVKELLKRFVPVNVGSPRESNMGIWVNYFLKEKSIKADSRFVNEFISIAGDSLYHLANEIDKIAILLQDGEELTLDHIKQFSGWKRKYKLWDFLFALGNRNLQKAIKTGYSLISQNDTLVSLLYPIMSLLQEMLFQKKSSGTFSKFRGYIPLSNTIREKIPYFAKQYSRQEIENALFLLGKIDERIKTTKVSDESELIQFIFNVISK